MEERFAGALHTAAVPVIAGVSRFKPPKQKILLCSLSRCLLALCPLLLRPLLPFSLLLFPLSLRPFALCSLLLRSFCVFALTFYSLAFCSFYTKPMRLHYCHIQTIGAYQFSSLAGEPRYSLHGQSPRSPSSILCPLLQSSPGGQARPFSLQLSALVKSERGSPTTSDVVARNFRNPVHHFERLRDNPFQEIRLLTNHFACDLIRKKQDALQPIGKAKQHLVVFVLFLHELSSPVLSWLSIR